jgi:hypothetical protein
MQIIMKQDDAICGNSFHKVFLNNDQYWQFPARQYSGPIKTTIRFRLNCDSGQVIHSNEFEGQISAVQFKGEALEKHSLKDHP